MAPKEASRWHLHRRGRSRLPAPPASRVTTRALQPPQPQPRSRQRRVSAPTCPDHCPSHSIESPQHVQAPGWTPADKFSFLNWQKRLVQCSDPSPPDLVEK
eukprot:13182085-Alexandrium_andersonii.AAC.1